MRHYNLVTVHPVGSLAASADEDGAREGGSDEEEENESGDDEGGGGRDHLVTYKDHVIQ